MDAGAPSDAAAVEPGADSLREARAPAAPAPAAGPGAAAGPSPVKPVRAPEPAAPSAVEAFLAFQARSAQPFRVAVDFRVVDRLTGGHQFSRSVEPQPVPSYDGLVRCYQTTFNDHSRPAFAAAGGRALAEGDSAALLQLWAEAWRAGGERSSGAPPVQLDCTATRFDAGVDRLDPESVASALALRHVNYRLWTGKRGTGTLDSLVMALYKGECEVIFDDAGDSPPVLVFTAVQLKVWNSDMTLTLVDDSAPATSRKPWLPATPWDGNRLVRRLGKHEDATQVAVDIISNTFYKVDVSQYLNQEFSLLGFDNPTVELHESFEYPGCLAKFVLHSLEVKLPFLPGDAFATPLPDLTAAVPRGSWKWVTESARASHERQRALPLPEARAGVLPPAAAPGAAEGTEGAEGGEPGPQGAEKHEAFPYIPLPKTSPRISVTDKLPHVRAARRASLGQTAAALPSAGCAVLPPSDADVTEEKVTEWLAAHGINVARYGSGGAKSIRQLAREVKVGECQLTLEKDDEGVLRPLRVVKVAKVLIRHPKDGERLLVETHQLLQSRLRVHYKTVSEKFLPNERTWDAVMRGLEEELLGPVSSGYISMAPEVKAEWMAAEASAGQGGQQESKASEDDTPTMSAMPPPVKKKPAKRGGRTVGRTPGAPHAAGGRKLVAYDTAGERIEFANVNSKLLQQCASDLRLVRLLLPQVEYNVSPSYPGLRSKYCLFNAEVAVRGLPNGPFSTVEGRTVHFWSWLRPAQIRRMNTSLDEQVEFYISVAREAAINEGSQASLEGYLVEAARTNNVAVLTKLIDNWRALNRELARSSAAQGDSPGAAGPGSTKASEWARSLEKAAAARATTDFRSVLETTDPKGNNIMRVAALRGPKCRETAGLLLKRRLFDLGVLGTRTHSWDSPTPALDMPDDRGHTLLDYAMRVDHCDIVKCLLTVGASPTSACLHCATRHGSYASLDVLMPRLVGSHVPDEEPVAVAAAEEDGSTGSATADAAGKRKECGSGCGNALPSIDDVGYLVDLLTFAAVEAPPPRHKPLGSILQQCNPSSTAMQPFLAAFLSYAVRECHQEAELAEALEHFVERSRYPLHAALVCSHHLARMSAESDRPLSERAAALEALAVAMLQQCSTGAHADALLSERADLPLWRAAPGPPRGFESTGDTAIATAVQLGCMRFVAAPQCQAELRRLWGGSASPHALLWLVKLLGSLPVVISGHLRGDGRAAAAGSSLDSPFFKFWSRVASALVFAGVLVGVATAERDVDALHAWELVLLAYLLGYGAEAAMGGGARSWRAPAALFLAFVALRALALAGVDDTMELADSALALATLFAFVALLRLLTHTRLVGVSWALIGRCWRVALQYGTLLAAAIVAAGAAVSLIARHHAGTNSPDVLPSAWEFALWSMFPTGTYWSPGGFDGPPFLLGAVVFAFLLCTTSLLSAFLVARLGSQVAADTQQAQLGAQFDTASLLFRTSELPVVPPPFNVVTAPFALVGWLTHRPDLRSARIASSTPGVAPPAPPVLLADLERDHARKVLREGVISRFFNERKERQRKTFLQMLQLPWAATAGHDVGLFGTVDAEAVPIRGS